MLTIAVVLSSTPNPIVRATRVCDHMGSPWTPEASPPGREAAPSRRPSPSLRTHSTRLVRVAPRTLPSRLFVPSKCLLSAAALRRTRPSDPIKMTRVILRCHPALHPHSITARRANRERGCRGLPSLTFRIGANSRSDSPRPAPRLRASVWSTDLGQTCEVDPANQSDSAFLRPRDSASESLEPSGQTANGFDPLCNHSRPLCKGKHVSKKI